MSLSSILIRNKDISQPEISIKYDGDIFINETNNYLFNTIILHKRKIGELPYKKYWEKMKKKTNEYELIHATHNNKNMSIADYVPLSRSYFKLWEMLNKYDLL